MSERSATVTALTTVVLMSLFLVSVAQGQETTPKAWKGEFRGYLMIGWSPIDIDDFNDRLGSKGYSKHSDDFLSIGGGAHVIIKRIVLGGEGHALVVGNEEAIIPAGTFKTSLSGIYGFLNVGYLTYRQGDLHVYPLIGLGGGSMNLKIGNAEFDEVLDNPRGNARLSSLGFLINLAVGADYFVELGESEKGNAGLVLGLRAGYTIAPTEGQWEAEGIQVSGGPDVGITGPYIRLMIGGGVIGKK
ncbi:MAG: hypothetical protein ACE5JC_01880 [Candidatus Zixiibacteriota bacterium]